MLYETSIFIINGDPFLILKTGEWRHDKKEAIKLKTHGRSAVSLFRYGLDYLVEALAKLFYQSDLFQNCLDKLTPFKLHGPLPEAI